MQHNFSSLYSHGIAERIRNGEIGILPTDTLYGICTSATARQAIEKIYHLKGRDHHKPLITLISSMSQLDEFIALSPFARKVARENWPGSCSIIFPCDSSEMDYLHRGTHSLAFRLPDSPSLIKFINKTGPIVAPSANPQGEPPAQTIAQAKEYFSRDINIFVDAGTKNSSPSKLLKTEGAKTVQLR